MAIINYLCPNCGGSILHEEGAKNAETFEICPKCGTKQFIKDLENKPAMAGSASVEGNYAGVAPVEAMVTYIDDAESALAYLENFFENYDWDDFMFTSALSVPTVDRMVDKILIKSAANPATWELQFTAITTPLRKKLNGLKKLEEKFFEEYVKTDDLADSFGYFDIYMKIVNKISANGQDILKKLNSALKYFKKYKGAPTVLQQLSAQLLVLRDDIAAVKPLKDYKELPGYAQAQETKQREVSKKLAALAIDAEAVYTDAVTAYNAGGDRRAALAAFKSISGYKDAYEYAQKIDTWLKFPISDGVFIKLGRKHYILCKEAAPVLSLAHLQQNGAAAQQPPAEDGTTRMSLYEIVENKKGEKPLVTGITQPLAYFGGTLVYFKNGGILCMFNSEALEGTEVEKVILAANPGDVGPVTNNSGNVFIADNKLFLRQKLAAVVQQEEKKGCFGKKKNGAPVIKVVNKNNFSLVTLSLVTGELETVVPEFVDIHCIFGKEIFFNKITSVDGTDKDDFYSYNYLSKETRTVLSKDTEIVDVIDGKVIYFIWTPNDYNKDLYALDLKTGDSKLLENNVLDYYGQIEGKSYYYVGNDNLKTLYRVNPDGTEKKEIRSNSNYFNKVMAVRNGWLYLTVGYRLNVSLVKMSSDGERYIVLCPQFKRLVELKDGYVYYVDAHNNLCVVRDDGSEYRKILDNVENFIEVRNNAIYLLRKEVVDETNGSLVYSNSLYRVNLEGAELKKVAFDVSDAVANESNKEELYLYKTNKITYSISVPVDKDNYNTTYETRTIKTVIVYNLVAETFREVAVFGKPENKNGTYTFKGGCFKKPVTKEAIVKEVPNRKTFKRQGVMEAGATADEQMQQAQTAAQNPAGNGAAAYTVPASTAGNAGFYAAPAKTASSSPSGGKIAMLIVSILLLCFGSFIVTMGGSVGGMVLAAIMCVVCIVLIVLSAKNSSREKRERGKVDGITIATIVLCALALSSILGTMFLNVVYMLIRRPYNYSDLISFFISK